MSQTESNNINKVLADYADAVEHEKAKKILHKCKDQESKEKFISVYIDKQTIKLIPLEKIKRKKMEIIKVKLDGSRLVFMEKDNAIKKGYITE